MIEPLIVWFDDDCGVCSAAVRFISTRTDRSVTYRPNWGLDEPVLQQAADDAVVVTAGDRWWTAVDAVALVLGRAGRFSRLVGRVLRLPGVHALAGAVYWAVARNRARISSRLGLGSGCEFPRAN